MSYAKCAKTSLGYSLSYPSGVGLFLYLATGEEERRGNIRHGEISTPDAQLARRISGDLQNAASDLQQWVQGDGDKFFEVLAAKSEETK